MCTLTGHSHFVQSVAFSGDGRRVVSGSVDRLVKIWDADKGSEVHTPRQRTRWCDKLFLRWLLSCFGVEMV